MHRVDKSRPLTLLAGGVLGAAGIALAAAASHGDDTRHLATASMMCLVHAPALIGLQACQHIFRTATLAAVVITLGTFLFAGDLVSRHFLGDRLFAMAAPIGGFTMIAGWLLVGAGAFMPARR